jgi:hypothetical protein
MHYEKTWLAIGELTEEELTWLYQSSYECHFDRDEIHLTTIGGSRVTMPDVTKITIKTYSDKKETMLLLRLGNRLILIGEQFYSNDHGCYINF